MAGSITELVPKYYKLDGTGLDNSILPVANRISSCPVGQIFTKWPEFLITARNIGFHWVKGKAALT